MERRTIIKSIAGVSTVALTGCLGDSAQDESDTSGSSDEWDEFNVNIDLEQDIEYWFPEQPGVTPPTYETDQPVEITQVQPYRKGDKLEIRGIIQIKEEDIRSVGIDAENDNSEIEGGPFGAGGDVMTYPETGEHSFTLKSSSTRLSGISEIKISVTGQTPEDTIGWDEAA